MNHIEVSQTTAEDVYHLFGLIQDNQEPLSKFDIPTAELYIRPQSLFDHVRTSVEGGLIDSRRVGFNTIRFIGEVSNDGIVGWVDTSFDPEHPELRSIGCWIDQTKHGKGYAVEAVELVLASLAQDPVVKDAELYIHRDNARSLRVAEKLDFNPDASYSNPTRPHELHFTRSLRF